MRNFSNNLPVLLLALAGAAGLWYWSRRTESGGQATSDAFDAAMRAAREAEGWTSNVVTTGWNMVANAARGIRNNNPGNIDRNPGVKWQGMAPVQTDPRFVVFTAPEWGIRAIARILKNYAARGSTTIAQIITTWAPPVENNTTAYIASVSREIGLPPDVPVPASHLPALIAAIIRHENGSQPYPPEVIAKGIELERTA